MVRTTRILSIAIFTMAASCVARVAAPRTTAAVSSQIPNSDRSELPHDASQPTCPYWTEGEEVRTPEAALCCAVRAGLPVQEARYFHVEQYGQTEASPDRGTHWMVYAVEVEECGPGAHDTYTAGQVAGIVAATGRVNTPMPWRFEERDARRVPACRQTGP